MHWDTLFPMITKQHTVSHILARYEVLYKSTLVFPILTNRLAYICYHIATSYRDRNFDILPRLAENLVINWCNNIRSLNYRYSYGVPVITGLLWILTTDTPIAYYRHLWRSMGYLLWGLVLPFHAVSSIVLLLVAVHMAGRHCIMLKITRVTKRSKRVQLRVLNPIVLRIVALEQYHNWPCVGKDYIYIVL